ncbi:calcium-dependent protein kinase 25-like [Nymphaea colorata]|nr:calcium-dependent protein kinase 25-like [Nymphaea colorata]XP_031476661.1 calcium-dependent protein kinase 25-like [Nymphaea colorata]XP_031476662.1 calcium-dependent protein kinase 25-like [Nymphaea colorata]
MAIGKGNQPSPCSSICYKVRFLTEAILDATQISNLEDRYVLEERLGSGQFGVIRYCYDKLTGETLACKSISKDLLVTPEDVRSVKLEIEIMAQLSGHPNVVDLKAVFEEEDYVHLVMELCEGGELYQLLENHKLLSEAEAVVMFKQLMEVLKFCHDKGVVHRDLKPENILLATNSKPSPIKLADFGLASYIRPGQALYGIVGSPYYIAPEVLAGGYNEAADVWSAGVILYILLSGQPPFYGVTKAQIFDEVRAADIWFPSEPWDHVSASAKDLIRRMLCRDPKNRLTAAQVLDHCWFKNEEKLLGDEGQFGSLEDSLPEQSIPMNCDFIVNSSNVVCCDVQRDFSPTFTCETSFSSFLADATGCSPSTGLSFRSSASSDEECSTPIASVPSFAFFAPCTPDEQDNSTAAQGDLVEPGKTEAEVALASRASGNRTTGLGEFEQLGNLDLMVTGSLVRWPSFTHLSNATPLQSLVC